MPGPGCKPALPLRLWSQDQALLRPTGRPLPRATRPHVATLARDAAEDLTGFSDPALNLLFERLLDLPATDLSLLVKLPDLIGPDLQRLREAIADDDPDGGWDALTTVAKQIDTPQQRAKLADALVTLRDDRRITRQQAAGAILDPAAGATRCLAASRLEVVAVSIGVSRTPGGLQIAA